MALDLTRPLRGKAAQGDTRRLLATLQGNILAAHKRLFAVHLFFRLGTDRAAACRAVRRIAATVTGADAELAWSSTPADHRQPRPSFFGIALTHRGYVSLGRGGDAPAGEPAFVRGMQDRANMQVVGDSLEGWEDAYRQAFDGLVTVGADDLDALGRSRDTVAAHLEEAHATIVHEQPGAALRDAAGKSIEHFGYRDSMSQPVFWGSSDPKRRSAARLWDPTTPLSNALIFEPPYRGTCGSYLVFRKLEQDVDGFDRAVARVAAYLGWPGKPGLDLAGALVMGRFKDGTPVTTSSRPDSDKAHNDFDFRGDAGTRCPYHAHIRKLNPRGSSPAGLAAERPHLMPRRGMSYEEPVDARQPATSALAASAYGQWPTMWRTPSQPNPQAPTQTKTRKGLLFMAYNASLANQFVFTQAQWANNRRYPNRTTGTDPVIGQGGTGSPAQSWHRRWNDPSAATPFDFGSYVTMRGGEYFFAPSLAFLNSL